MENKNIDGKYYEILGKCLELRDLVSQMEPELKGKWRALKKVKGKKRREISAWLKKSFKNFDDTVQKIEKAIEKARNDKKDYPILNIINRFFDLDQIGRIIFYYGLAERIMSEEPWDVEGLLIFLSKGDYAKFTKIKMKYLQWNSHLSRKNIIFPRFENKFIMSSRIYDVICGKGTLLIDRIRNSQNIGRNISSAEEIYQFLSRKVVGQEEAKKVLSVVAFQHYQRITGGVKGIRKSNVMLIGPTGVGKTYLVKTLAEYLKVPVVFCSANEFTETGYVGKSVGDIIGELYRASNSDIDKAEKGIVFIDEIDKIATCGSVFRHRSNRDVSGRSVQEELLDLLESHGKRNFQYGFLREVTMDISNVLFIVAGAFEGIEEFQERERRTRPIGFAVEQSEENIYNTGQIEIEDLINYGLIPEFVGRFSWIVTLNPLTPEDLVKIMVNMEDSVLNEYKNYFKQLGVELEVTYPVIERIANIAYERGTGARGLRSIFENILSPYLLHIRRDSQNVPRIVIDENVFLSELSMQNI